jgi:D-alanyl-D-alanine carboxypeptidase/D-alanyl-D-alanine-endopeptidase (penicillin-binding protein 4)
VFDKNSSIGLAPASTQKIITSAAAYDLLGKDFRYKTEFGINKSDSTLNIIPSGDPTFGSWRWPGTNEYAIMKQIVVAVKKLNVKNFSGVVLDEGGWDSQNIPDGWTWEDIGNYYGAGAAKINWRENQFDLLLKSGKNIGDTVEIVSTLPELPGYDFNSIATSAEKGSGDNTYIYFSVDGDGGIVKGTIPVNENKFVVSGAMANAADVFLHKFFDTLQKVGAYNRGSGLSANVLNREINRENLSVFYSHISPSLDSIVYWLNKKSINLYAEALVKTIGYQKAKTGSTEKGVELIQEFWKQKGIDPVQLNMLDGSGLSPSNRITTGALVKVLQYAKKQSWFNGFFNSLPEYNGMKMKSGTIKDVKGFAGYHTSKKGVEYIFSFLVNNYNGPTGSLVQKMYRVLDELK